MPSQRNKRILIICLICFFASQTIVLMVIPGNTNREPVTVVIRNKTGLLNIAAQLKDARLISSSSLFVLCSLLHKGRLIAGEYSLRRDMSIFGIVRKMGRGERNIYALRILEGHNLYNVAETMEQSHIMEGKEFLRMARDKGFLTRLGLQDNSLEGYLAPDTYFYSKEIGVEEFVEKIVQKTFKNLSKQDVREGMTALGFDMHKTLTLASMIEKEAKLKEEKPLVSAVFHNRLHRGMSLDSDPTVIYGSGQFGSPITRSDLSTYTPYNTYTFKGLPQGPICNPDGNSIRAALNPAPVAYLYFVSKNDGSHVFSSTIEEHSRYVALYQRTKGTKTNESRRRLWRKM
jgi:UPF0755 protein